MRVVFANKYHFLKGGAERYLFELAALLERHGHTVIPFAMRDRRDFETEWRRYFVSPVRTEKASWSLQGLKTAGRIIWSGEARRKFSALCEAARPDLVHVHNIYHQISPSILPEAKRRGLPVVLTAHDYKLISPNYSLFHDGAVCEPPKGNWAWGAVRHRCVRGSTAASLLCATEYALHRLLGAYQKNIDRIIAPSRFMAAILADYGLPAEKIVHIPHFIGAAAWQPRYEGDYALFVGRLVPEKGVETLIRAAAMAHEVPVRIVGDGPDGARLKSLAEKLGASNVEFRGLKSGADLVAEYAGARFVVIPSVWYEVFGLVALEAYAAGKPVVASQIGGLAELVRPGETGVPVSAGDAAGLAEVMSGLWADLERCAKMGRAGRAWVEQDFSPEKHYERIFGLYRELTGKK